MVSRAINVESASGTAFELVPIRRVAIIGAGVLGRRLAALCCEAGYATVLEDVLPSRLRSAARLLEERASDPASGDASSTTDKDSLPAAAVRVGSAGPVKFATTIEEAVRDADVVIDCVPDELESKLEIFSLLDRMAPPHTILATPTRSLSIADLASCTYRAERCVGLELPPEFLGEGELACPCHVKILQTSKTESGVIDAVTRLWRAVGFEVSTGRDPQEGNSAK